MFSITWIGNVRILDKAVVSKSPVKPQKYLIIALAIAIGAIVGPGLAILFSRSSKGIQSPNEVYANTGLELYGTIPQSTEQTLLLQNRYRNHVPELLVDKHPNSQSIEALRGLRVSLRLTLEGAANNRILITGPTPGIGKSFIASNFSILLAQAGRKVLLINADFRKGKENDLAEFGLTRAGGFSELLAGKISEVQAIHQQVRPNLDVLTTGALTDFPIDMLESESFYKLLERLSLRYQHIVIDAAPILVAADATAIAPFCGCILLVAKAEESQFSDINESIRRLAQVGASVNGILLNGINSERRYNRAYKY